MNLTPQSMRSPISPFEEHSSHSFSSQRHCYPTTPQPEQAAMEHQTRGLGIFECPMPQQQSTVHELPPSPQQSDSWSHTSMMEQDFPQTSQPPDIFTAAFDPFSGYNNNANGGMMAVSSPEAPGLVFCQTPPNIQSHRSSISSSYSPPHHGSDFYTPRVKAEDHNEWYSSPGSEQILQRSMATPGFVSYPDGVSPVSGPAEDMYRTQTADWSKPGPSAYPLEFNNMVGDEMKRFEGAPVLPSVHRIKKKRQRTTPEEATHECRTCGKLFKRSYNWKSHLETHNPERKYPHPCTAMVGNQQCTKKFQRKTDLDRHYDSVHLKARNHRCNLCGNRFARRDTLRRHTEDGCPKRFELGFREVSAAPAGRWSLTNMPSSMGPPPMSAGPLQQPFQYSRELVSSPIQAASAFSQQ